MDIVETGTLLAKIQAFDNRNAPDEATMAWQEILEPHILPDCLAAVTDYFKSNTGWIMPAHIVERVRAIERDRVDSFGVQPRLSDHDERTCEDYSAAGKALFRAVKTGAMDRAAYELYQESTVGILDAIGARKAIK